MLKRILFLLTMTLAAFVFLHAQVTTSSITGVVKTQTGEALAGASVTAVHTPSGTTYNSITGRDGVFNLLNLRIGGPYSVRITFTGWSPFTVDGFNLELGQPYNINAVLAQTSQTLETVVVSGTSRRAAVDKTGASTNINSRQLATLPTISRSITDFTRITPQANGAGFNGRDPRYNNIQIDGANLNNNFGLSNDPLPGGGVTPISIDAIDQVSVNIAPYDVRQGNFTGAGINAVTRSGDNTFRGSAYTYYRDQSYNGTNVAGTTLPPLTQTSNKIFGGRFGGPIVKNKLFFFINGEAENRTFPSTSLLPTTQPGQTGSNISVTPIDSLAKLSQFLKNTYGYETGSYNGIPSFQAKIYRVLGRVDWNVSKNHKLTFKYSEFKSTTPNNSVIINGTSMPNGGGSILSTGTTTYSFTRLANNRFSNNSYGFENSNYGFTDMVRSATVELNSRISNKISNQLIGSFTKIRDTRSYKGGVFPTIDILNLAPGAALNNQNYMTAGMDPFTYNNDVVNDVYSIIDNFSLSVGKHNITAGGSYEYQRVGNMFMPGSNSYYVYRSLNDFITNQAPVYYALTYSLIKGTANPYASNMKIGQLGLYVQDEVQMSSKFRLTYGLRVDRPNYLEQPASNPAYSALTFPDKNGQSTNYTTTFPNVSWYWSPRVGFRLDAYGDKRLLIRGGTGIFTGRMPFVWLTNISQNNGMVQSTVSVFNTVANPTATNGYLFNPNPLAYAGNFAQTGGTSITSGNPSFAAADPNFKFPQVWRSNLAMDKNLGSGFMMTLELIHSRNINEVWIRNANLVAANSALAGTPDTRPRWVGSNRLYSNIGGNYVLENTNRGGSFSATAQLSKAFSKGFYGSIAYTYTFANSLSDNASQQAPSLWNTNPVSASGNAPDLSYSSYALPHRVVGNLSYRFEYLKALATTIGVYYEGAMAGRFSYVYSSDVNGDGNGNDLIYIPRDATEINLVNTTVNGITYTPAQQWAVLDQFINNDPYLRKHRGQVAERSGAQLPWYNRVDVKFLQEIFGNIGKRRNTLQFSIDILNALNLINPNLGVFQSATLRSLLVPNNTYTTSGAPQFRLNSFNNQLITNPYTNVISTSSTYGFQLGLRYIF